ncbi:MAG: T9SS type A sorting domain-containing protein, partial [Bacteroidota bacterium]
DESVLLEWVSLWETNSDRFEIERSVDGRIFTRLGEVAAQGESDRVQEYQYLDRQALTGISYYRLAQYDLDGSISYSATAKVRITPSTALVVYPNPCRERLYLQGLDDGLVQWEVFDLQGRLLLREQSDAHEGIALSHLGSATYLLKVFQNGRYLGYSRFQKVR